MSSNRAELKIDLQKAMILLDVWQTCLNCVHWQGNQGMPQQCEKFKAMPPPHIIVSGCRDHEADIPF